MQLSKPQLQMFLIVLQKLELLSKKRNENEKLQTLAEVFEKKHHRSISISMSVIDISYLTKFKSP